MLSARPYRRGAALAFVATVAAVALATSAADPAQADSVRNAQAWVLSALQAQAAWKVTQGQGVTVAVIDSGVNAGVSDIAGSVTTGPDYTGVTTSPSNANWGVHGTWMASLIAGHGHSGGGSGILGIAPKAHVLSIRVITDSTDPNYASYEREPQSEIQSELAKAITYAVSHGASVISMSLGYGTPSAQVRSALQEALSHGVVVVASSGNAGDTAGATQQGHAPYAFPADYPGVLAVAALSQSGAPADFSSDNISVQVAAPGVNVPAQGRDGGYWLVKGTSPACALTAGVAALIKSAYPALPADLVREAITGTTTNRPKGGYDEQVGFGTVDAAAALSAAASLSASGMAGPGGPAGGSPETLPSGGTATGPGTTSPDAELSPGTGGLQPESTTPVSVGLSSASHFGGGPAAIPPSPVAPRGIRNLALLCLLAVVCMAVIVVTMRRLAMVRRPPPRPASYSARGDPETMNLGLVPGRGGPVPPPGTAASVSRFFQSLRFPWSPRPPARHALPRDVLTTARPDPGVPSPQPAAAGSVGPDAGLPGDAALPGPEPGTPERFRSATGL